MLTFSLFMKNWHKVYFSFLCISSAAFTVECPLVLVRFSLRGINNRWKRARIMWWKVSCFQVWWEKDLNHRTSRGMNGHSTNLIALQCQWEEPQCLHVQCQVGEFQRLSKYVANLDKLSGDREKCTVPAAYRKRRHHYKPSVGLSMRNNA